MHGTCPVCHTPIPDTRLQADLEICPSCGWSRSRKQEVQQKEITTRYCKLVGLFSVVLIAGFIHAVNWDRHSHSIVPLKVKQWLSIATLEDLNRLAEICRERLKPECVENAYADMVAAAPDDLNLKHQYGKLLNQVNKPDKAVAVLNNYFAAGGTDADAAYEFAKALGATGNTEKAIEFYDLVLEAKPDTLQITVLHSYVDFLMQAGRYEDARRVIESTRRKGDNTAYFMEGKLKEIKRILARG